MAERLYHKTASITFKANIRMEEAAIDEKRNLYDREQPWIHNNHSRSRRVHESRIGSNRNDEQPKRHAANDAATNDGTAKGNSGGNHRLFRHMRENSGQNAVEYFRHTGHLHERMDNQAAHP